MRQRFVGRSTELHVIEESLHRAAAGQGGVVLVAGPAGIGKTTLVNEVVTRSAREPWRLGRGFCLDEAGAPPLWPWMRSLRLAGVTVPEAGPEPGTPAELASARFRQLSLAADGLAGAARDQPLLIVLEDLHWADSASLALLRHVAEHAMDSQLLVLATVRDPAPDEVIAALADLTRYGVQTVRLQPFTPAEIGELVGPADLDRVASQTGGLPLLVAATAMGAGSDLTSAANGLLRAVPTDQQSLLLTAAVISDDIDETLVATVSGGTAQQVGDALESARQAGLAVIGESGYRFAHPLMQDALAAKVPPRTANEVHREVAQLIKDSAPATTVAAHWRHAGNSPEALREVVHWSRAAAQQALEGYAVDEAIAHLETAYDAATRLDDKSADVPGVLLELATAEYLGSRFAASLQHCAEAARLGRELGLAELTAKAALVVRNVSYPEAARVVLGLSRQALVTPDLDPALRARLLAQVAAVQADDGDGESAKETAMTALRIAVRTADPLAELDAVRAREMCLTRPDDVLERLELADRATELAHRLGDPVAAAVAQTWRARAGYQLARLDIVDGAIRAIGAEAESSSLPLARWHYLRASASRAALYGDFDRARTLNAEAMELAAASGDVVARGMSYVLAQYLGELRGDPGEVLPGALEAMHHAPPAPIITTSLASLHVLRGERDEAARYYEELVPVLRHPADDLRWGAVLLQAAQLAVFFGDAETGELLAQQLQPWTAYPGAWGLTTSYLTGSASQLMGRLALLVGDHPGAERWLRAAVEHNIALRARPYVVLSKLDLAEVLHIDGRPEHVHLIEEAEAEAKRLDMPGAVARAGRLRESGAGSDPLSPREREVFEMLVQAFSNKHIAAQLVVSERTVESHVRSILTKLGCANRSELIAREAAGRHRLHERRY